MSTLEKIGIGEQSLNGLAPKVDDPEKFRRSLVKSAEKLGQAARHLLDEVLLQHGISEKQIEAIEKKVNRRLARRDIHISDGKYSLDELALIFKAYEELLETKVALRRLRQYLPKRVNN